MRACVGIDPGVTGALAIIVDQPSGRRIEVWDAPTVPVKKSVDYLVGSMRELLSFPDDYEVLAAVERGMGIPGQSAPGAYKAGRGVGIWEGLLAGLGIPYEMVMPNMWKRQIGIASGSPKSASRVLAQRLFPEVTDQLERVKDDGRADALLIAEWRRRRG